VPEPGKTPGSVAGGLSGTLRVTHDAIAELQENLRTMRDGRDRSRACIEALEKELADRKSAGARLTVHEEKLRSAFDKLREENGKLKALLIETRQQNEHRRLQLKSLSTKCYLIEKQAAKLRAERDESLKRADERVDKEKARMTAMEPQISKLIRERDGFNYDLEKAKHIIHDLRNQLISEREFRETVQFDLSNSRSTVNNLKHTLTEVVDQGKRSFGELSEAFGEDARESSSD
jgi:chromosome segregation ATPase